MGRRFHMNVFLGRTSVCLLGFSFAVILLTQSNSSLFVYMDICVCVDLCVWFSLSSLSQHALASLLSLPSTNQSLLSIQPNRDTKRFFSCYSVLPLSLYMNTHMCMHTWKWWIAGGHPLYFPLLSTPQPSPPLPHLSLLDKLSPVHVTWKVAKFLTITEASSLLSY